MAKAYDIEQFILDTGACVSSFLPAKLTSLNAEKNDGITLDTPDSNAYFVQRLDDKAANYPVAVFYGVESFQTTETIGPATAQRVSVFVTVILSDSNNNLNVVQKLFRYQRALKEIFEENWASVGGNIKFKIVGLQPVPIEVVESRLDHIIGILLEATIA